jgi:hypothetical protein
MYSLRHVGYQYTPEELALFSPANIRAIGAEAASAFTSSTVFFADEVVRALLETNYFDYKPALTDLHSAYYIEPFGQESRCERAKSLTINMLLVEATSRAAESQVVDTLDIDVIKYCGEISRTPSIKLRERKCPSMLFNMNY